jgi:hypothetical protein
MAAKSVWIGHQIWVPARGKPTPGVSMDLWCLGGGLASRLASFLLKKNISFISISISISIFQRQNDHHFFAAPLATKSAKSQKAKGAEPALVAVAVPCTLSFKPPSVFIYILMCAVCRCCRC